MLNNGDIKYYSFPNNLFKEYTFMRIGTLGDGSCLIHSILTALNGNDYIDLGRKDQQKYVDDIRSYISESISYDKFMKMKTENKPLWMDKSYYKNLLKDKYDYKISPEEAYSAYVAHLKKYSTWLGSECLQLLCDHFDIDIFILNEDQGLVFQTLEMKDYIKKRNSIIVLHKNGHYEPIGIKCIHKDHQPVFVFRYQNKFIKELRRKYRYLNEKYIKLLNPSAK